MPKSKKINPITDSIISSQGQPVKMEAKNEDKKDLTVSELSEPASKIERRNKKRNMESGLQEESVSKVLTSSKPVKGRKRNIAVTKKHVPEAKPVETTTFQKSIVQNTKNNKRTPTQAVEEKPLLSPKRASESTKKTAPQRKSGDTCTETLAVDILSQGEVMFGEDQLEDEHPRKRKVKGKKEENKESNRKKKKSADVDVEDKLPNKNKKKSAGVDMEDKVPNKKKKKSADVDMKDKVPNKKKKKSADVDMEDQVPNKNKKKSADVDMEDKVSNKKKKKSADVDMEDKVPNKKKSADVDVKDNVKMEPCAKFVGAHVSISGGLYKAVEEAVHIGARAFGMFLKSQRQWASKPLEDKDAERFKAACQEHGFPPSMILPHGSYLMNCGSPDEETLTKSQQALVDELQRCEKLGLTLFNFHPGSTCGKIDVDKCLTRIADSINKAHKATKYVTTVVENMSCQGNTVGGKFEELRGIIDKVEDKSRIGVCLDTCHAFAAGFDLSTEEGFEQMMNDFDQVVGLEYLKAMHLNDSKGKLACRLDRHENIGKGHIGKRAFQRIMTDCRLNNIPMILETPFVEDSTYAKEIKMLYSFCQ